MPTEFDIEHQPGLEVGGLLYPGPERFDSPGDITNYGYKGETALFRGLRLGDDLEPGAELTLKGRASWLVCKSECRRGTADLVTTLRVSPKTEDNQDKEVLLDSLGRLPRPWPHARDQVSINFDDKTLKLLAVDATGIEFFPFEGSDPATARVEEIDKDGAHNRLLYLDYGNTPGTTIEGVLRIEREQPEFYEIKLERPF